MWEQIEGARKHDWALFKQGISMSTNLVILGRPPGRALFNVKSRTLRVLTMMVCWWRLNVVTMATPLIFLWSKKREHTQFQDKIWIEKRTYFGVLTYLPHTWSLQNFKCMEFKSPFVVVLHQGISRCCSRCSSHVRRCYFVYHSSWSSPRKVSDQKYLKENNILEHALAFIEREINK